MKSNRSTKSPTIKKIAVLLLLVLGSWGLVPSAQAQGTEYDVYCGEFRNLDLFTKIEAANDSPGLDTISLADTCTYTLFIPYQQGKSGLPAITDHLIIEGNGATIQRTGNSGHEFRLMEISAAVDVTVRNLTLQNGSIPDYRGGAIYAVASSSLTLDQVHFVENKAANGGAVFAGTVTVRQSEFLRNQALSGNGGGLYAADSVTITNSYWEENQAMVNSGGVHADRDASVTNGTFVRNTALTIAAGGLYVRKKLDLRHSYFERNTAGGWAGGLWLLADSDASSKIVNNVWVGNKASNSLGGAMYLGHGDGGVDVQHNTIVGSREGNGITVTGDNVTVENSIISLYIIGLHKTSGNTAASRFNLYYNNDTNDQDIDIVEAAYVTDPLFGEAYRLSEGSPAIDAGTNLGVNEDYEGAARPLGNGYDIGAYEYNSPTAPGTFTIFLPMVTK